MKALIILVINLTIISITCSENQCSKPNQVYHDPVTNVVCTRGCRAGCYCDRGYEMNVDGDCVAANSSNCPYKHMNYQCGWPSCMEWCGVIPDPLCDMIEFHCKSICTCDPGYIYVADASVCETFDGCRRKYFHLLK